MELHGSMNPYYALAGAVCVVAMLLWLLPATYLLARHARDRVTCASFASYSDILAAFHTYHYLDGDNDGVPCENRLK